MGFGGQGLIYLNPKIAYLLKDLYKEIIIGNPETEKVGYLGFRLGFKTLAVGSQLENEWARRAIIKSLARQGHETAGQSIRRHSANAEPPSFFEPTELDKTHHASWPYFRDLGVSENRGP